MSWPSSRGCVANKWRRVWAWCAWGDLLARHCVPQCALQDGLVQVVAVALPGAPIKVDPGAPGLALDCVYHRSRTGHVDALL